MCALVPSKSCVTTWSLAWLLQSSFSTPLSQTTSHALRHFATNLRRCDASYSTGSTFLCLDTMEQHGSSDTASYFFKLPREIRDQTYGYLAREEKLALNKPSYLTCFWIQGYTRMSYRLVSRRFGREYREQLQRTMVLHIELRTDTSSCFQNDLKRPGRSIIYGNVRHVVVNFVKTETSMLLPVREHLSS